MRICITRSEKHAYSETFIRDQIAGFSKLAEVFTVYGGRYPEREESGKLLSPKPFWVAHKAVKLLVGRNNFFSNYGMKKFLKKNQINVVLANYGMCAAHMVPVCKALDIPLLVIFHGHDATDQKLLGKYRGKYQKLFGYAASIIVVSNDMAAKLTELGAPAEKIQVVPCGVDTDKFKPTEQPAQEQKFLAVGRFAAKKGPLYTIDAFSKVYQKFPDATLTMVGKKTGLFDECEAKVAELGLENAVTFTGILDQSQIAELMGEALAFVQHSITAPNGDMEGTPVSIMEAGASGLPIVSTEHGGIKDAVVHGRTGFLVKETDADAMANFMMQLCEDPIQAKAMGLEGREHIQKNYLQKEQIKKLYDLSVAACK
ncbi:glycosyltransferase [Flagellimonas aequoris]|uniref:Glycosyltransferase n=1 Tax=Flagellimonas aequoris TaxID=2306997 RepID=A0A418N4H9_9FLAO|nr:glycosyltransferase [Allomuricauda aequoris]RIV68748.1 glycosyltransferase [Allomuricauda aequoris]TXK00446.1 glycosyltransferase [Allomuricauda aequoris]